MADAPEIIQSLEKRDNLAAFLADPKGYAQKQGLNTNDAKQVKALEFAAKHLVDGLAHAKIGLGIGSTAAASDWGIGAGCCNAAVMFNHLLK